MTSPRESDSAAELLEALVPVVRSRMLSLDDAWAVVAAVAPVLEAQAKVEASREVRDSWQQGEWTMLTPHLSTLRARLAAARAVTDWLSARVKEAGDRG